jgi:hypothetical protein
MKKSMKFATALAGAAVVVVGGTAFTAANDVPDVTAGTDTNLVSGAVVESQVYTLTGTKVTGIVFTVTDLSSTDYTAKAKLDATETTCTVSAVDTISCAWDPGVEVGTLAATTLTVYPNGA